MSVEGDLDTPTAECSVNQGSFCLLNCKPSRLNFWTCSAFSRLTSIAPSLALTHYPHSMD